jgi:uncharacterized metal-binding protein YceD (DUF177 family)
MNEKFIIPLNGLTAGKNEFFLHAGKEFFDSFGNEEIFDADLQIRILVEKSGRYIGVDCDIEGVVTVECDRCLEMLDMPVDVQVRLSVKFGEEEASEIGQETEREVIFVKEDEAELDMSQIIYDYACLALPMQRVHEDGECDPEAMKYYGLRAEPDGSAEEDGENPFSALKNMFK